MSAAPSPATPALRRAFMLDRPGHEPLTYRQAIEVIEHFLPVLSPTDRARARARLATQAIAAFQVARELLEIPAAKAKAPQPRRQAREREPRQAARKAVAPAAVAGPTTSAARPWFPRPLTENPRDREAARAIEAAQAARHDDAATVSRIVEVYRTFGSHRAGAR